MSKKRGLSSEEKRTKMMEIFFETKDVFQLKDLEKIAPREKGITAMSVKEVLQSVVDDAMVDTDRIGTSNYYWAFPSKALNSRQNKLMALEAQLKEGEVRRHGLQESVVRATAGREDTEERTELLQELARLRSCKEKLQAELDKHRECDPEVISDLRKENEISKDAANRWTDNVFSIKSWAKRRFGLEEDQLDKSFGIPEEFDYIE
ncbi:meiotic nuclear division protein 1 homolog [Lethenteron reissneri]|uniref:meiotic nuclear division protein 1 homolog n=1 Tax=Lethenteron reissneri TaxID=7753 RepID=UPI002AB70A6E|nr:meiotic nuclear division protein 1 homolog [Lethenteron reissneri]XP_061408570.1 meiotic nuclear division protein 1 homolog [Lethenteron reissneri]